MSYPPPKELNPRTADKLAIVSLTLVAVGIISVIRVLLTAVGVAATHEVAADRRQLEDPTASAARAA